jgi:predicted O-methyltransferase YrrM
MSFRIIEYLKFLSKSSNQHGVHSPFVYNLVTLCFYKKINPNQLAIFLNIKKRILNYKKTILVNDLGSGSRIFKTNKREISNIGKIAGISKKKAAILIRLIDYYRPSNILEIGTSVGLSTSAIKIGNDKSNITTLEGCLETSKIAKKLFKEQKFNNINIITGNFKDTIKQVIKEKQFDFIYFDGNHTKKDTLNYFKDCLTTIKNDSFWVFDDIYWNQEMKQAWSEIKKHPKVTVTIDIFHWGIVFFRKEQAEEHFKIRV